MYRRRVFYLRIAATFLIMLLMLPVSIALNHKVEDILGNEVNPGNETPKFGVEKDTLLEPVANGTNAGIKTVGSIVAVLESDQENLNQMKTALISLNENVAQFNSSAGYPEDVLENF